MMDLNNADSASHAALALPELLERIILELPVRDILTSATRVSGTWQATINSSQTIRQKLFLPYKYTAPTTAPINSVVTATMDIVPEYTAELTLTPNLIGPFIEGQSTSRYGQVLSVGCIDDYTPAFRLKHIQFLVTGETFSTYGTMRIMNQNSKY